MIPRRGYLDPDQETQKRVKDIITSVPWIKNIPMILPDSDLDRVVDIFVQYNYQDDFTWSPVVCRELYVKLLYHGFIPLCSRVRKKSDESSLLVSYYYYLLPKIHVERCIMFLKDLHVSTNAKKHAHKYSFSIDTNFESVIEGCIKQHGDNCWVYPPLSEVQVYTDMFQNPGINVSMHSIELWHKSGTAESTLVAGEIGCVIGKVYTSLTGFHTGAHTGTIQLCALAKVLIHNGFEMWDLGMELDYKIHMGAVVKSRKDFVQQFRQCRQKERGMFETKYISSVELKSLMKKPLLKDAILKD